MEFPFYVAADLQETQCVNRLQRHIYPSSGLQFAPFVRDEVSPPNADRIIVHVAALGRLLQRRSRDRADGREVRRVFFDRRRLGYFIGACARPLRSPPSLGRYDVRRYSHGFTLALWKSVGIQFPQRSMWRVVLRSIVYRPRLLPVDEKHAQVPVLIDESYHFCNLIERNESILRRYKFYQAAYQDR